MRPRGVPVAVLLASACLILQVSGVEDLYWEGEEDASNEFLEVHSDKGITGHLKKFKRDLFDIFSAFNNPGTTTTTTTEAPESVYATEDPDADVGPDDDHGSGSPSGVDDLGEKMLRVTFVVMEPYLAAYSNRDSPEFQNFSRTIGDAVDLLYKPIPGEQKASLVRIQSRISDEFSCKVTLDIVSTNYDDLNRIGKILRDHIKNRRELGVGHNSVKVSDADFTTMDINPNLGAPDVLCAVSEIRCGDNTCVPGSSLCNGVNDCLDGSDEAGCNRDSDSFDQYIDKTTLRNTCQRISCSGSAQTICLEARCDGIRDCPLGDDEENCEDDSSDTIPTPETTTPYPTDETGPLNCPEGEFPCDDTRCVSSNLRCDGRFDCYDQTDEKGCPKESCGVDDFRCTVSGKCIEARRKCDSVVDCPNEEDEQNCECREGDFQCVSDKSCIEGRKRCDGVSHCRDSSDEQGCQLEKFRCRTGQYIPDYLRCNRRYDCPPGDYSDEQGCPCGDGDFKCDNGNCIPASKQCDRTHDCQDGSDERDCSYASSNPCPSDSFTCNPGSSVACARRCDDRTECDDGEDEENCDADDACSHTCDGICLEEVKICDGVADCSDSSDELTCDQCDGPNDYRCNNGECININQYCNGIFECSDSSDEMNCNSTMITRPDACSSTEFQCNDGICINNFFRCDGRSDCVDSSDEEDCGCDRDTQWQCTSGTCIPNTAYCDGFSDCTDQSDESDCPTTRPWITTTQFNPNRPDTSTPGYQNGDFRTTRPVASSDNRPDDQYGRPSQGGDYSTRRPDDPYNRPNQGGDYSTRRPDDPYNRPNQGGIYDTNRPDDPYSRPNQGGDYSTRRPDDPYNRPNQGGIYDTNRPDDPYSRPNQGGDYSTRRPDDPYNRPSQGGSNGEYGGTPDDRYNRPDQGGSDDDRLNEVGPVSAEGGSRSGPITLDLMTYPSQQTIRNGGDVVFQCRDEGPLRAAVRWVRDGGRPLKPGSTDKNGRLEMNQVTMGDSGVYICQAVRYLGNPGAELRVTLKVEPTPATPEPPPEPCKADQATCANGQCIPKTALCNNVFDCSDRSDEEACHVDGKCEPNQFKCDNNRCILKTWRCDSEDDCHDGSDERDCGISAPGKCRNVDFACASGDLCIPKSFHCDGESDCPDRSDEIGCSPVYVTRPPQPSNVYLQAGETLTLNCSATGTPIPMISWRRNWGHVPETCTSENVISGNQVIGILVCANMQPEYNGAYSCEALNNKGTIFAVPDAIVFVNKTSVCRSGFFNREARTERDCIRCFCFGESTSCRSADLFTYNMPTPLGEGGTRLVGVKNTGNGDIQLDSSTITNEYYYQPLRNGATVTKLAQFDTNWGSNTLPYLVLPETYNGNQLTSYGGHIRYRLSAHNPDSRPDNGLPDIIIKGKYQNLIHMKRGNSFLIDARLTPENWLKSSSRGLVPASREDIMMALDNIEMILIRSSVNNAGVNVTDFVMESAHHIDTGLGATNLVEECTCPPGYQGLSCQKCAPGYHREQSGRWLGNCVREPCPPGTYGDPESGIACKLCPCPLTNKENQFARTCSLGYDGTVVCDCNPGYEGRNCERCSEGYVGNPLLPGDSCQKKASSNCNPVGTSHVRLPDECECKDNVQGRFCNQCKNDSFYLSNDFRQGCALCFCSGVSQQCMSSSLRRKTTNVRFNTPDIVNYVKIYASTPLGAAGTIRYKTPVETNLTASYGRDELILRNYDSSRPAIYYWSLPIAFAGDKVTSYGGHLRYTLRNVPASGYNTKNGAADVQLISENHLTFHYFGDFKPTFDGNLEASIQFMERGWQRPDGKEISREHFLLALADVKTILIKATYSTNSQLASLVGASIDTADEDGDGPPALHVEQCVCPRGYIGTSCEDCAPGYTRYDSGLYLEHCGPCECNGHSNMCHAETGICSNCQDNTEGNSCERCKPGFTRDPYTDKCVPEEPSQLCNCDPRGSLGPCDDRQYCTCKENVEGQNCDICRPGTFGLDASNPSGCYACYCSGATSNCHEASSQYIRIPMAAPVFGDNNGGYTLMDINAQRVISDQIVSMPTESELMYIFQFPPNEELYWSLPVFPGNRILSYGGTLQLKQRYESSSEPISEPGTDVVLVGDDKSLYWTNPQAISAGQGLNIKVPLTERGWFLLNFGTPASRSDLLSVLKNLRRVLVRATLVKNIYSTSIADVSMDTATDMYDPALPPATGVELCMCPEGYSGTSCESCKPGYYKDRYGCQRCNCNGNDCYMTADEQVICNCRPPYTGNDCSILDENMKQDNGTTRPPPPRPSVFVQITSPTIKIQDIGSSVNFTCQAQSRMSNNLPVTWSKDDGYLPQDRTQLDDRLGMLIITNLQTSDSGKYICQTTDGISTAQAIATLRVPSNDMTLPTVMIKPPINDYFEGERIELECTASGNPSPTINWQRSSGRPLPQYAEVIDDLFIIENAREEDSGEYRCRASNTLGSADRTAVISIRPRPSNQPRDQLTVTTSHSPSVAEGQNIQVVCTGTTGVPTGTIDWVRQDGKILDPNVQSRDGVLYINYARLENQGVYICQTSSYNVNPVLIVMRVIPLSTPSPDQASNITVSKDSLRIPTGGSGTVDCNPTGLQLPLIRWSKHQGKFGDGTSQRQNTLVITNAKEEDKGYYMCEGTIDGRVIANIYVYVDIEKRVKPRITIWPAGEQAVTLGSPFDLRCSVTDAVPEPLVTWSRTGGRPLSPHTQLLPNNILRFEGIEVNDEGEYSCTATNVAGTATASATIKVRSAPVVTLSPSNFVEAVYGDPVTIECRANGYPQPYLMIKKMSPVAREIAGPSPGYVSLKISSVSDRDDGEYSCIASSPAGTIDEAFAIHVDRGDGGFGTEEGSGEGDIDADGSPSENQPPGDMIALEGQVTRLGCDAPSDLSVQWSRADRRPLQANAIQQENNLIIRSTSKQDAGQYVCTLFDRENLEVIRSVTTSLVVMASPRITLQPPTQTVHPGESPTVECIVTGDDIEEIVWRPLTRPFSSRVEIRGQILTFNSIEVEDAGKYECYARNRVGKAVATAEVLVSEETDRAPSESHDNEQRAHVGAAVHLRCDVQPSEGYRITWTKDDRQLPRSVVQYYDGSLYIRLAQKSDSGHYVCNIQDKYGRRTSNYINLHIDGAVEQKPNVRIRQPHRKFRVGENVQISCDTSRDNRVTWERYGTNQFLPINNYGGGTMLILNSVQESDAGHYRCTTYDPYGNSNYDDLNLEVIPGNPPIWPSYPSDALQQYTVRQGDSVDMPCNHNLDQTVSYEWRREYTPLQPEVRFYDPTLHLERVTEADAGTYVCRVSNSRTAVETLAVLRVAGVVPRFDGSGWISLPTLQEAYRQFDIEISFKPIDGNGLILYNGEKQDRSGDYLALQLVNGVPQFQMDAGSGPVIVDGDRPLQLNTWHTIRISKTDSTVIMDVDNNGPTSEPATNYDLLELRTPLYIGGVPDYNQLPPALADTRSSGFIGCVSMLVLGNQEKNIMLDRIEQSTVMECDSCNPNLCNKNGVCQEARNERGYMCLCAAGFAGLNCDRTGEACKPGLCGPGKCTDTADGYKCACPVTYTGKNCDVKQSIEYPAFTGSAYLAIKAPKASRHFHMSMKVKAAAPVTDGIIMYSAESARGYGGFTALTVHNGRLEFIYDLGDGSRPVVLTNNRTLPANEWTDVHITRVGPKVTLTVGLQYTFEDRLESSKTGMNFETPMFVGGADDSIILNKNTGVTGGFHGCIKEVMVYGISVDIVNSSIQSANVQECSNYDRGDIPESENICTQCRNGGQCTEDGSGCECPYGFAGRYCETRVPLLARRRPAVDPCALQPCRNGGTCRPDLNNKMNYTCDCRLGYAGATCQMVLDLRQSVAFNGNGYLELPASLVRYDNLDRDPLLIAMAFYTNTDGVLLYQREVAAHPNSGDFILIRIENGFVVFEWDLGGGLSSVSVGDIYVSDLNRHSVIVRMFDDGSVTLTVDHVIKNGTTTGFTSVMNADSNIYVGGIPDSLNVDHYPGLSGCVEQIELMGSDRGINLGREAVAGRNTQRCRNSGV